MAARDTDTCRPLQAEDSTDGPETRIPGGRGDPAARRLSHRGRRRQARSGDEGGPAAAGPVPRAGQGRPEAGVRDGPGGRHPAVPRAAAAGVRRTGDDDAGLPEGHPGRRLAADRPGPGEAGRSGGCPECLASGGRRDDRSHPWPGQSHSALHRDRPGPGRSRRAGGGPVHPAPGDPDRSLGDGAIWADDSGRPARTAPHGESHDQQGPSASADRAGADGGG